MKVLVLEDDPALRFALSQVLEDANHEVFAAGSIAQAVEILKTETLNLLLLDLMIGQEDTIQVADLAGYSAPNAEVIYLTGSGRFPNGELFRISKNAGWVLRKPVDFPELASMLEHISATQGAPDDRPRDAALTA